MFDRIVSALGATAATAALLAMLSTATPASAQTVDRVTIPLAGRDLSNPAEAAKLDRQIRRAAEIVCEPDGDRSLPEMVAVQACRTTAVTRAHADLQLAMRSRSGGVTAVTVR